jgi:WD40 repeat protein
MLWLRLCLTGLLGLASPLLAQAKGDALPPGAVARLGEVRYRNVGRVFSIAFSPDSRTLAAGAWDGSIRLWEPVKGREIRQYVGHNGWVKAVAFSPDGKTLASGGKDRIIRLWETASGKELHQLEALRDWVQQLAFSSDGKILASWGMGQTLWLWDVATGRELRRLGLPKRADISLAFSANGKHVAYLSAPRTIAIFDVATGKEVRRLMSRHNWLSQLAFSPDGKILAAAHHYGDYALYFWDVATGQELRPLGKEEKYTDKDTYGVVFAPDGRSIATVGDHALRVWEVKTRRERCRFLSPDKKPSTLAFAPDGRTLAQGSDDATVLLWDVTGRQEKGRLRPARPSSQELQTLWADLAGTDAAAAYRAIWTLVAGASESVPYIQEHLRPVAPAEESSMAQLVADLDSEQYQTRKAATERLEKLGDLAEPVLRQALQPKAPLETRQRVERLLELVAAGRENPSPDGLRVLRAVEALERMNTPAARHALEQYARGAPGRELTRQAKAALERLAKR